MANHQNNSSGISSKQHLAMLIGAGLLAIACRLPFLTTRSIWYDESSSWQVANFSFAGIVESCSRNVHAPLYYFILKIWIGIFGESVLALRGLSVVFGIVTVLGMYMVAFQCLEFSAEKEKKHARWFPFAVALLVAVSPFQINASIETRMYALGTALTATSAFALLRLIQQPKSKTRWGIWCALCVLLTYTHHHCLFVVASQFAYLLGYSAVAKLPVARWPIVRNLVATAFVVLLAYVPGAMLLYAQIVRVRQDYWTAPMSIDLISRTFAEFLSPLLSASAHHEVIGLTILLAIVFCSVVALRTSRFEEVFALVLGVLPMGMAGFVTVALTPVWEGRFFRFCHLFILLFVALVLHRATQSIRLRVTVHALMVACMLLAMIDFWTSRNVSDRGGMREVFAKIEEEGGHALIVSTSNIHYFPAKYYAMNQRPVKLLESSSQQFWGDHLIRSGDLIADAELTKQLEEGVWILSHSTIPCQSKVLKGVVIDRFFKTDYDHGVYNWTVFASKIRRLPNLTASQPPP